MRLRTLLDFTLGVALVDLDQTKADGEHDRRANDVCCGPKGDEFQKKVHAQQYGAACAAGKGGESSQALQKALEGASRPTNSRPDAQTAMD